MSQIHWPPSPALENAHTPHSVTAGWVSTLPRLAIIQYGPTSVCLTTIPHHNDDNYYHALRPLTIESFPSYQKHSSTTHYANAWVPPKSSVLSIRNKSRHPIGLSPSTSSALSSFWHQIQISFLSPNSLSQPLKQITSQAARMAQRLRGRTKFGATNNHHHVESTWSVLVMLSNGQVFSSLPGAVL